MNSFALGKLAYEAYREYTGELQVVSNQPIPEWEECTPEIKEAWRAAAIAVSGAVSDEVLV